MRSLRAPRFLWVKLIWYLVTLIAKVYQVCLWSNICSLPYLKNSHIIKRRWYNEEAITTNVFDVQFLWICNRISSIRIKCHFTFVIVFISLCFVTCDGYQGKFRPSPLVWSGKILLIFLNIEQVHLKFWLKFRLNDKMFFFSPLKLVDSDS